MSPSLSVVVLTFNEAANIRGCLQSLARQNDQDFEIIVIDAASADGTQAMLREMAPLMPMPVRLELAARRLPIGEARNLGVQMALSDRVAFLSADAEAHPDWVARIRTGLDDADMVFGRQVHDPRRWTLGAAVRGLRYHFPDGPDRDALRYASNVSAGYHRKVLLRHPFDPDTNAAEDTLLARRADADGAVARYDPLMLVWHHDVATAREEMRKAVREGAGMGRYVRELGPMLTLIAWGVALLALAAAAVLRPDPFVFGTLALALWLPALRRAARRHRHVPPLPLILAVAATPVFDLAFLVHYARGLLVSQRRPLPPHDPQEYPQ